jgi:hypothetical protein
MLLNVSPGVVWHWGMSWQAWGIGHNDQRLVVDQLRIVIAMQELGGHGGCYHVSVGRVAQHPGQILGVAD